MKLSKEEKEFLEESIARAYADGIRFAVETMDLFIRREDDPSVAFKETLLFLKSNLEWNLRSSQSQ